MAKKIKETPILTGKDAKNFYRNMEDVKKVSGEELARIKNSADKIKAIQQFDNAPISNIPKEQTAAKPFEQILKEGNEGYPFRDVIDNLTDGEIIACVETYAAQQVALHSKQPPTEDTCPTCKQHTNVYCSNAYHLAKLSTEDKQPGETVEQAAEKAYPLITYVVNNSDAFYNNVVKDLRDAFLSGANWQSARSNADGWVTNEVPKHPNAVWAMAHTLGGKLLIPTVAYYSDGTNITSYNADEEEILLDKGWYTLESQMQGDCEEVYQSINIACWKDVDYNSLPQPPTIQIRNLTGRE